MGAPKARRSTGGVRGPMTRHLPMNGTERRAHEGLALSGQGRGGEPRAAEAVARAVAAVGREDLLLRLAAAVEAEGPEWFARPPPRGATGRGSGTGSGIAMAEAGPAP